MTSKDLSVKLAPVLEAVAERIHYAETRRTNYTVMAIALIAGGISILVFASGSVEQLWLKLGTTTAAIGFCCVGIAVLYAYGTQTNQYPYTTATTTWKWFYRDGLPKSNAFKPKLFEAKKELKARISKAYTDQLSSFKSRLSSLVDDDLSVEQDMEQIYSLHVNEFYKNLYLTTLRKIFNRGLIATLLSVVAMSFLGAWLETQYDQTQTAAVAGPGWFETIEYRPLNGSLSTSAEVAFHATVTNKLQQPIQIARFAFRDRQGWLLPVDIKTKAMLPKVVKSKSSADLYFTATIPRAVWDQPKSFELEIQ